MKNIIEKRLRFQKAFNLPVAKKPTLINHDRYKLQYDMMNEDLEEYKLACVDSDIIEVADALMDMQEVLLGMFAEHGMLHLHNQLYNEVHVSNMSKLDDNGKPIINGENGVFDKTRPIGKVLKSDNFVEPNISKILNQ